MLALVGVGVLPDRERGHFPLTREPALRQVRRHLALEGVGLPHSLRRGRVAFVRHVVE